MDLGPFQRICSRYWSTFSAVIVASAWFGGFSAVSSLVLSVVSVIVAALAAFFAYRAFHMQHADTVTERLYNSLGDLLAAVTRIEFAAGELYRSSGDALGAARHAVSQDFVKFLETVARVKLARAELPSIKHRDPVGQWIMDVANNLSVSLLQADEFGTDWQQQRGWARPANLAAVARPAFVLNDDRWELLTKSASFWSAYSVTQDLGPPPANEFGFKPLDEWWSSVDPYLGSDVGWLAQHARLLSDFGEYYISEWANSLVASGALEKSRSKVTVT